MYKYMYSFVLTVGVIHWLNNSLVLVYIQVQLCTRATTTGEGHAKIPADTGVQLCTRVIA